MNCVTTLYDHQQRAVEKLIGSRVGALFMDMGTGKTRTAIEFVRLREGRIHRVVWFCPVSLKETIAAEILKHTDCQPGNICVFDEQVGPGIIPHCFWYVIGIESMSASARVVLAVHELIDPETFVILDESSYIKNHSAKRTFRITELSNRARYRMVLTGTPISQGVVDLFAQMYFLSPKILGYHSFYTFAREHLVYSDKYPGRIVSSHNVEELAAKIAPYTYQVTKEECLTLPAKLHESRYYAMSPKQSEIYEQAKWEILGGVSLSDLKGYTIFLLFTALQQISSGFWPRKGQLLEFPHDRLTTLLDVVEDIAENEQVIIWCKYRYSLDAVARALQKMGECACLHGGLSEAERMAQIAAFRAGRRFLVATMQTGGHGFTLNEAASVIFYENGFKYSDRAQAEDRNHRIGQTRRVTYIDITCKNGIERRIMRALETKGSVVKAFREEVDAIKDQAAGQNLFQTL